MINSLLPVNGDVSIYRDCMTAIGNKHQPLQVVLDVAKCFLTNAKLTCDAINLKDRLTSIDPIVGDEGCQIRALVAITSYLDADLKEELNNLTMLNGKVSSLLKQVNHLSNKPPLENPKGTLMEQLEQLGLSLNVSEKVDYLLRSHFLAIGKYLYMNIKGEERSGIDCQNLKNQLKTKVRMELLKAIVDIAREKISQDSTMFIQAQGKMVDINVHTRVVPHNKLQLHSSCAFYNLMTVLKRACQMEIPILIKEFGVKNPRGIYFRGDELVEEALEPKQPILVIESFFPEGCEKETIIQNIQGVGLLKVILASVACVPQYPSDDDISGLDLAEQDEILNYRQLGKDLGCDSSTPAIFKIAHIHAATVKEEKVR